ncbi:hypothetical protein U9M48_029294 [Paspalum notatum var. saurae]|uniref:RNase H type-1 domain-containing protein n=1 Tax=Paspalum notatum var. saurae TaxID=547442 RepID=A0AAQ3X263_PASNO
MLSRAGKEILIKAVAQAIPTYAMGCFDITKSLCDQISLMIARFWWGQQDNEHKIHWLSWERLVQPKEKGGLGFRDIHSFNLAMLAKQLPEYMEGRMDAKKLVEVGTWDEELVKEIFWEEDAELILSLTVHEGMNDIAAWHFDKHGLFSVKSAYKIHQDDMKRRITRGDPSSAAHDEEKTLVWKKLWKGRWTRKCKQVTEIWKELNLKQVRLELADKDSAMEIIRDLVKLNEDAQTMTQPNIKGAGQQCWKRPPENMLKLNCDGAYHATKSEGWGFVIRDDDGAVVKAGKVEHAQDVFQVELIACFQAVKYAMEIGVTNIIIESDSLMVKQAATSEAYRLSDFGGLIWELKDLLAMLMD